MRLICTVVRALRVLGHHLFSRRNWFGQQQPGWLRFLTHWAIQIQDKILVQRILRHVFKTDSPSFMFLLCFFRGIFLPAFLAFGLVEVAVNRNVFKPLLGCNHTHFGQGGGGGCSPLASFEVGADELGDWVLMRKAECKVWVGGRIASCVGVALLCPRIKPSSSRTRPRSRTSTCSRSSR